MIDKVIKEKHTINSSKKNTHWNYFTKGHNMKSLLKI